MTGKGTILTFRDTAAIETEAAAWVARFDAGDVTAKDQAAFQEWLNRSARHRGAIAELGSLWSELDMLKQLAGSDDIARMRGAFGRHSGRWKKARPWLAACAAAAIAMAGGAVLFRPMRHSPATMVADRAKPKMHASARNHAPGRTFYETAVGGQRQITLADGTSVILNTNSRLDVDFSAQRRDVHLIRGEAYFDVVHDKARPFTVYANTYVVRDIGTAFDVHLSKAGLVEVGVTKGSVEVAPTHAADTPKRPKVLAAGHNIVLGRDGARSDVLSDADMARKLAWRQGELIYSGQPLGQVLADVGRYSDIKIELADPALANMPVGGAFRTDQIEAIFTALENNFGVHAEWIDPQHVRFTANRGKAPSRD